MTDPIDGDNVLSLDQERLRIRTHAEDRRDQEAIRLLNTFIPVGRIQINPGGGAVPTKVAECMFCYALVIAEDRYRLLAHAQWHEGLRRRTT